MVNEPGSEPAAEPAAGQAAPDNGKPKPRGMLPRRASDALDTERWLRACLIGETGGGKSWRAAMAPRPFVILTEANGEDSVVKANRDAVYVVVSRMSEVRHWIGQAASGALARDYGVRSLVIDGITEVQRLFKDEMTGGERGVGEGNKEMSQNDWGILADKMRKLLRTLRALPLHVVCTVLATNEKDGDRALRVVPQFQGRAIQPELGQYFNLVAYCYRADSDDMPEADRYLAMVTGPSRYLCKGCDPVVGIRRDGPAEWFSLILGSKGSNAAGAVVADAAPPKLREPATKPEPKPAAPAAAPKR